MPSWRFFGKDGMVQTAVLPAAAVVCRSRLLPSSAWLSYVVVNFARGAARKGSPIKYMLAKREEGEGDNKKERKGGREKGTGREKRRGREKGGGGGVEREERGEREL